MNNQDFNLEELAPKVKILRYLEKNKSEVVEKLTKINKEIEEEYIDRNYYYCFHVALSDKGELWTFSGRNQVIANDSSVVLALLEGNSYLKFDEYMSKHDFAECVNNEDIKQQFIEWDECFELNSDIKEEWVDYYLDSIYECSKEYFVEEVGKVIDDLNKLLIQED